jgi:phage shock protein C
VNRRLYRSRTDRVMQGVAGGVAEYLDVDPTIVRVIWALLALVTGGVFAALYIVMWAIVPEGPAPAAPAESGATGSDPVTGQPAPPSRSTWSAQPIARHRRGSGSGSYVVGLILVGLGLYFLVRDYFPGINLDRLWPLGLVVLGVVLLFVAMRRRPE